MKKRAIFIDKDGTLVKDVPYSVEIRDIHLLPGVETGLRILQHAGYEVIVVTNQSGVARGYYPEHALLSVEVKIRMLLQEKGVLLNGFYYCPHHPEGTIPRYSYQCTCRKPQPGMLISAAEDMDIDFKSSWMIGDILNDVEAGNRVGCQTILINNGNETEWESGIFRKPTHVSSHFLEAVNFILFSGLGMEDFLMKGIDNE